MPFCRVNKLCLSLILGFSQLVATNTQPDWCLQKISFFNNASSHFGQERSKLFATLVAQQPAAVPRVGTTNLPEG